MGYAAGVDQEVLIRQTRGRGVRIYKDVGPVNRADPMRRDDSIPTCRTWRFTAPSPGLNRVRVGAASGSQ